MITKIGVVIGYFLLCSLIMDFIIVVLGMADFTIKEITKQIVFGEVLLVVLFVATCLITGGK